MTEIQRYRAKTYIAKAIDMLTRMHNVAPFNRVEVCDTLMNLVELVSILDTDDNQANEASEHVRRMYDDDSELSAYSEGASPNWRTKPMGSLPGDLKKT